MMMLFSGESHRIVDFDYYKNEDIVVLLQQTDIGGGDNSHTYLTIRLNIGDIPPESWSTQPDG